MRADTKAVTPTVNGTRATIGRAKTCGVTKRVEATLGRAGHGNSEVHVEPSRWPVLPNPFLMLKVSSHGVIRIAIVTHGTPQRFRKWICLLRTVCICIPEVECVMLACINFSGARVIAKRNSDAWVAEVAEIPAIRACSDKPCEGTAKAVSEVLKLRALLAAQRAG